MKQLEHNGTHYSAMLKDTISHVTGHGKKLARSLKKYTFAVTVTLKRINKTEYVWVKINEKCVCVREYMCTNV